jgi:prephenate dehydrogenase
MTPTETTPVAARERVERFWRELGANVVQMGAAEHDRAVAATSHLPHVVAAALAAATPAEYLALAATGWLDSTRIAAGDVELWRQILKQNRTSVLRSLEQFGKVLNSYSRALEQQDDAALAELLAAGKQRRDALAD